MGSSSSQARPTRSLDGFCLFPSCLRCQSASDGENLTVCTALPTYESLYILISKSKQFAYSDHWQTGILSRRVVVHPIDGYVQPFRDFFRRQKLMYRFHRRSPHSGVRSAFRGLVGLAPGISTAHPPWELLWKWRSAAASRALCAASMPICTAFGVSDPKVYRGLKNGSNERTSPNREVPRFKHPCSKWLAGSQPWRSSPQAGVTTFPFR